jgi:ABC-type Fe3+-hydroxamate transport system substrate-binding protein
MKRIFTDQMSRVVEIKFPPLRIVSLVPSQTELLYDLGLKDEVVGQTLFCIHPNNMHQEKIRVGGTKKMDLRIIEQLKPDLIIGNKEENDQSQIEELMKYYPVWMSDIKTLEDALDMIERVGEMVDRIGNAKKISSDIKDKFEMLSVFETELSVAYLIWRKPYMAAGGNTFINDMLSRCGYKNLLSSEITRYPELTKDQIQTLNPGIIFLSSEPYPFKQKHIGELNVICPDAKVFLVDGELFSWYGSRLMKSAKYFLELKSKTEK